MFKAYLIMTSLTKCTRCDVIELWHMSHTLIKNRDIITFMILCILQHIYVGILWKTCGFFNSLTWWSCFHEFYEHFEPLTIQIGQELTELWFRNDLGPLPSKLMLLKSVNAIENNQKTCTLWPAVCLVHFLWHLHFL